MEKRYRIEEESTSGWEIIDPSHINLTRERASEIIRDLCDQGHNPNRIRVVREQ